MASHWIFQANPSHYDIDGALEHLTELRWRVPQYTGAVAPGDEVALWRAGDEAGFVGVGRITGPAAECGTNDDEAAFVVDQSAEIGRTTQVPLAVRSAPLVSKATVEALPSMADHAIITAPRSTVFALTDEQWAQLAPLLPAFPPFSPDASPAFAPAFAWAQRRKDVYPLPGGYSGYLASLELLLGEVVALAPTRSGLEAVARTRLGLTETSAQLTVGFLLRMALIAESAGVTVVGPVAERWLADHEAGPLIAVLHSRVRFVGELLAEIRQPRTDTEILNIANQHYGMGWQTKAQIRRRRGWLESAGMLADSGDGRLTTTAAGLALIEHLDLHARSSESSATVEVIVVAPEPELTIGADVSAMIDRLRAAANDGTDPARFEKETAEAFRRLGFAATWLGGAGRTDVLLEADLGRDASYRVVIDCKSTSRGTVSQQIDWDTIDEHREQHHAQHAAIVAPAFGGGRLPDRAERHDAIMLTVDDLAELLVQHTRLPQSLDTYRLLFNSGTTEDGLAAVGEAAQENERRFDLAQTVIDLLHRKGTQLGALSARDLMLLLSTDADLPDATVEEVAEVVAALSSPLLRILTMRDDSQARPTGSTATATMRLRALADRLGAPSGGDAGLDT